jgi:beta-galactosidase
MEETVVHIDYMQSGIGSNSCGPKLSPELQMNDKTFGYAFRLLPVRINDVCPFEKSILSEKTYKAEKGTES